MKFRHALRLACLLGSMWLMPVQAWAINLNDQWQVFWDTPAQMQPADLFAPDVVWQPDTRQGMNGYEPGVFWAQFNVPATPPGQSGWLLAVGKPYLDRIDVYRWGQLLPLASMGDTLPAPQPRLSFASHVVRLPEAQTEKTYLIRVHSTSAMNIQAQLLSDTQWLHEQPGALFRAGVFFTWYLMAIVIAIAGAVVLRQPVQFAYSAYLLCLIAVFLGVNQPGLLNEWLGSPRWANWVTGFGVLLAPAAGCLLWLVVLRLRSTHPMIFKIFLGMTVWCVLSLFTINTPYYQPAAKIAVLSVVVYANLAIGLALRAMRDPAQRKYVGMFLLAFLMNIVTVVVNNLSVASVIAWHPWFATSVDVSSLAHVILLALATNFFIRKLQAENAESQFQQRLLTTQRDQIQRLSGFVAHEFLTPLARIGRSAEMLALETPTLAASTAQRAADIRVWAFETGKLVEAFLNSASLKSGQAVVKPEEVDVADWFERVRTELNLNYGHANLQWQLASGAPHARFDPMLAKVALENTVINALKYAGADNVVAILVAVQDGSAVITVDDQGPGLKPEQYARVGQAGSLRQSDQTQPGFGLGLSLVTHIAQAHGGNLSASPRQPSGVRWVIKLGDSATTRI